MQPFFQEVQNIHTCILGNQALTYFARAYPKGCPALSKVWSGGGSAVRKRIFAFGVATLLLTGCTEKPDESHGKPADIETENHSDVIIEKDGKTFFADPATFHFTADWLTNSKILFVEKEGNNYLVKSFDFDTGETETLYEEASIIIDLLIHPSKNYLLLHTSNNPTSATVKIITTDGLIQDEIEVASTELAIEWNDLNPSSVLLTAFYDDWSYDLFLYDGRTSYLGLLEIEDPFPKWFGENRIAIGYVEDHILDGGEIHIYEPLNEAWVPLEQENVIYFDTYEDSILTVQINQQEDALYRISDLEGTVRSEWTLPAISNYSEWVIPEIDWLSNNSVILSSPAIGGQLDEITSQIRLIKVIGGMVEEVDENHDGGFIRCSPSAKKCITGTALETVIDLESGEKNTWLRFPE